MKRTPWLSWRLYFLTFPIDVFVLLLSSDHASTGSNDYLNWAILSFLAHGSIAPVIAFALLATSKADSWKAELLALLFIGAIRGIAINAAIELLALDPTVSPMYKVFNSAISLPLWFIGVAIFIESRRQFQQEFEAVFLRTLRKKQSTAAGQNPDSDGISTEEPIMHLQSAASILANEIDGVLNLPTSQVNYEEQTGKIRDLINKELRPVSAQLWTGSALSTPKFSVSALIRISLFEQKLKVVAASVLFSPYIFIGINGTQGLRLAAIETILATFFNILIFYVCEMLFKSGVLNRKVTNTAILGFSFLLPLLTILFILPESFFWTDNAGTKIFYQIFLSSSHIAILLGFNVYKLLERQRSAVLQNLEQMMQVNEALPASHTYLTAARDSDLARYLHGELQAGLVATSLLLERASSTGNTDLARRALRSAADILRQDHVLVSRSKTSSPQARLERISSGWRGIAEVSIDLNWISDLETSALNDVIALIDEGVSNAIRHARSTTVSVTGAHLGIDLHVKILSNGSGMTAQIPGLGTKLFNELASSYSYEKQGELNLLKFTVRADNLTGL